MNYLKVFPTITFRVLMIIVTIRFGPNIDNINMLTLQVCNVTSGYAY